MAHIRLPDSLRIINKKPGQPLDPDGQNYKIHPEQRRPGSRCKGRICALPASVVEKELKRLSTANTQNI